MVFPHGLLMGFPITMVYGRYILVGGYNGIINNNGIIYNIIIVVVIIPIIAGWCLYTHPSEKYVFVSWDDDIPNWMEKEKPCSKPPTNDHCWQTTDLYFLIRICIKKRTPQDPMVYHHGPRKMSLHCHLYRLWQKQKHCQTQYHLSL